MKKLKAIFFFLFVFINFLNAEVLFNIHESLTGDVWTNFHNDKDYSLVISCGDKDDNGIKGIIMNGICFIKENENITISYDNAYTQGGGGGGGIDGSGGISSGSVTKIVKTTLKIQNINKIETEKIYDNKEEILLKVSKDDCFIIKLWEYGEGSQTSERLLYTIPLIGVNEIYGTENDFNISGYNGSLFYYTESFKSGDTHSGLDYKLNVSSNEVCAKNSISEYKEWYVQKGSELAIDYKEGDYYIPNSSERQKTAIFINEKLVEIKNSPKTIDEDMKIELCIVPQNFNILYKDKISAVGVNIKIDDIPPVIHFSKNIEGKIWINESIEVYANDDKTGVKSFEIRKEENSDFLKTSGNGSKILLDEDGRYIITAVDCVGNQSQKTIKIDKTLPSIKIKDEAGKEINENVNGWFTDKKIIIQTADETSGIKDVFIKGNSVTACYEITENGEYEIEAEDNAGNKTEKRIIKLDNKPPEITMVAVKFIKDGNLIKTITAEASVKEVGEKSGLSKEVYIKNGQTVIQTNLSEGNEIILKAEVKDIDRGKSNTYKLKVEAKDNAGNKAESAWDEIVLPPKIELADNENSYIEEENGKKNTVTELKFNNYKENSQYYEKLKLKRTIYINKTEITEENFSEYFSEDAIKDWREITKEFDLNSEEIKDGIYKDKIRTSSGFGHKKIKYTLSWEIEGLHDEEGNQIREESNEIEIVTANNPGEVRIRIEGENDKKEINFASGKFLVETDELKLAADGAIRISIMIYDEDYEPYETELNKLISKSNPEISTRINGFIQRGTSGKAKVKGYEERYVEGIWISYKGMEYLSYNREICLCLRVKEGYDDNKTIRESGLIYLKAEPQDLGGFVLKVCEAADYNANGITANPYQPIELEIISDIECDISWDFGDNENRVGSKVEHFWEQKADRTGDTSEYEMTIRFGTDEAKIPVHIVDTRFGALYGDEVWYGKHEILGKIEVNQDQTLSIGNPDKEEKIEILCASDEEESYMGCLEIKGKLKIANGKEKVIITAGKNTEDGFLSEIAEEDNGRLYWKGIEVIERGVAVIDGAIISGSERAISVDKDGKTEIRNSTLSRNGIGLHVLGECVAEEDEINWNEEYGIKEEDGCIVNIKNVTFSKNKVDWYSAEEGVLRKEEIEKKSGE